MMLIKNKVYFTMKLKQAKSGKLSAEKKIFLKNSESLSSAR